MNEDYGYCIQEPKTLILSCGAVEKGIDDFQIDAHVKGESHWINPVCEVYRYFVAIRLEDAR